MNGDWIWNLTNMIQYIATTLQHTHTNLVHMSPVLAVVIEAFPHHAHDFGEGHNIVGQISDLWHQRAAGAPWVIGRCLSNLDDNNTARGTTVNYPQSKLSAMTMISGANTLWQFNGRQQRELKSRHRLQMGGIMNGSYDYISSHCLNKGKEWVKRLFQGNIRLSEAMLCHLCCGDTRATLGHKERRRRRRKARWAEGHTTLISASE